MYYIYHIVGVKIGCTTNPKRRVEKQQGVLNYEILEIHSDINIASNREIELQKEYGYVEKNCNTNYVQQYKFAEKGRNNAIGKGAKVQIENKIGMFGFSKEERRKLNASIAHIGGNVTKERYSKPIDMFDYKTGKYIKSFTSKKQASIQLNISNIGAVLNGSRSHTKGYTFRYK